MWQLPAAEDASPVPREPAGPSGGHSQALRPAGLWSPAARDAGWDPNGSNGPKWDKYPECSSSETTGLAASWQSGPASAPPSQEISTIRKSNPSLSSLLSPPPHLASFIRALIPSRPSRLLSFTHQCHLPPRPPCSLCKWHPLGSCNQGSWVPLGKQRSIQMGTYSAPRHKGGVQCLPIK